MQTTSKPFSYWLKKNWYYHDQVARFYQFAVAPGLSVLQLGCKAGTILASVQPARGVGVDSDPEAIGYARKRYPHYTFLVGTHKDIPDQSFDVILFSCTIMELDDIQTFLQQLQRFCHAKTRIIIDSYNSLWEPALWFAQRVGLKRPTALKNWISLADTQNFLLLAGFQPISTGSYLLFPRYIPFISRIFNALFQLPLLNRFCLMQWVIARPIESPGEYKPSVSVIIPCRNEKGNIEQAVKRCPSMGSGTEIIFVEGNSKDGTFQEIERVANTYPEKHITYCKQPGKGKGDAVRCGFARASGDILMILDADLTVMPEELPKFYYTLVSGTGEFINGSRLIYGMESGAMRFLNLLANYFFGRLFSWILRQRIKDTLCGTKVLFKKDYEAIALNRAYFGDFDPFGDFDLLFGAGKLNLKIIDLPVRYKSRSYGTTQIRRFYHGVILLRMSMIGIKKFRLY